MRVHRNLSVITLVASQHNYFKNTQLMLKPNVARMWQQTLKATPSFSNLLCLQNLQKQKAQKTIQPIMNDE